MSGINDKFFDAAGIKTGAQQERDGFKDNKGDYPRRQYVNRQTTNIEARGIQENTLPTGGGDNNVDLEFLKFPASEYPYNQVKRSIKGHIHEVDDTAGRERILIKHTKGSGVEFHPDGTVTLFSCKNNVTITAGNEKVIVEGDGDLVYHGNLRLRVDGNFDLSVGGDFNVEVSGDHTEDIKGGYRQDLAKNFQSLIGGNYNQQIAKNKMDFLHGQYDMVAKGNYNVITSGTAEVNSNKQMILTSEKNLGITSPSVNIAATSLTAIGAEGTMGGDGMVIYANTTHSDRVNSTSMHASNSVHASVGMEAPTFNGNLSGNASTAGTAGTAALGASAGSAQATVTLDPATNKQTAEPTTNIINSYLNESEFGVRGVLIDVGNVLFNQIDRSVDYENVSDRTLTVTEARSKLRDPLNQSKERFIGTLISEGNLSESYANAVPENIDRIVPQEATPRRTKSVDIIGKSIGGEAKRFAGTVTNATITIDAHPKYKPDNLGELDSRSQISQGISIAKFLGGYGDSITFDHVTTNADKLEIARNLYLHALAMKSILYNSSEYANHRLIVVEGLYKKHSGETLTEGGINDLKSKGRAVVYELRNNKGVIDNKKTFDLATWWKDSLQFEKMILSYDTFDPNAGLIAQIILVMPELPSSYQVTYTNNIETQFNNFVQSTNELMEITTEN